MGRAGQRIDIQRIDIQCKVCARWFRALCGTGLATEGLCLECWKEAMAVLKTQIEERHDAD
jgi:hypothetical protein